MKFDWCETNLNIGCGEYKYDHCEVCNIARAYQHGYEIAQEDMSKTGWIPCSERLPKAEYGESDCVLATCCWKSDTKQHWIKELYFNGGNWCYPTGEYFTQKVIAWMPLPKPYKGSEEEPGQWQTEDGRKTKAEYSVYCSKCGSWSEYRTKYCGNCGSLMKEENDDR